MNELEQNHSTEITEESPIEYGSSRYYNELYIPDGWLSREVEIDATQKAVEKYLGTIDTVTAKNISNYLEHAHATPYAELVERQNGEEVCRVLRFAMLRLMDTMQDRNGREEGLYLAKQIEAIELEVHHFRREAYDALPPKS